jgi:hypothetical protein
MGEKSDAKLMYSMDGEHFTEISELPEINSVAAENDIDDFGLHDLKGGSMTVKLTNRQVVRKLMAILTPREFTNGWRRRHGLPMIRKAALRRLRRNKGYDEP